jgi:hypothetical protein
MSKVLTATNVSELLKISAGENEILRRLTEALEKRVEEEFQQVATENDKQSAEPTAQAASASAGQTS